MDSQENITEKLRLLGVINLINTFIGIIMTTIIDTVINEDGTITTHTYVSELPNFQSLDDWMTEHKTKEDLDIFIDANKHGHNLDSLALYRDWIVSQKIVHTVEHSTGKKEVNDYKTYQFE